jgi:hypothetical protein
MVWTKRSINDNEYTKSQSQFQISPGWFYNEWFYYGWFFDWIERVMDIESWTQDTSGINTWTKISNVTTSWET